jgi:ubiquinone/menaquinone biosynthesis C-methylase UbiE
MQESAVPDIDRCHLLPHAEVVELLELRPGMPVAEMGARQGRITSSLSNAVGPEGRVYGLEREPEPLASLGEKRKSQPNMANLLAELYDRSTPLGEASRLLREDGRLSLIECGTDGEHPPGPPPHARIGSVKLSGYSRTITGTSSARDRSDPTAASKLRYPTRRCSLNPRGD